MLPSIYEQQIFKEILRMDFSSSLGKYLEAQVDIQGSKIRHFTPLLEKVATTISQWKNRPLSQSTKLIIINSIIVASIMHQLGVSRIPTTIVSRIDSMIARFFWGHGQDMGVHWRKRSILQAPKGVFV